MIMVSCSRKRSKPVVTRITCWVKHFDQQYNYGGIYYIIRNSVSYTAHLVVLGWSNAGLYVWLIGYITETGKTRNTYRILSLNLLWKWWLGRWGWQKDDTIFICGITLLGSGSDYVQVLQKSLETALLLLNIKWLVTFVRCEWVRMWKKAVVMHLHNTCPEFVRMD